MPTASSARLLAAGAAAGGGGPADRWKSSDSPLLSNNKLHGASTAFKSGSTQHGQLSSAAGSLNRWAGWPSSFSSSSTSTSTSTTTHSAAGPGGCLSHQQSSSSSGNLASGFLTKSALGCAGGGAAGVRSSSVPRSCNTSSFARSTISSSSLASTTKQGPTTAQGAASTGRSSSTGRVTRTGSMSSSTAAANIAAGLGMRVLPSRNPADSSSSSVAAVPGRARIMPGRAAGGAGDARSTRTLSGALGPLLRVSSTDDVERQAQGSASTGEGGNMQHRSGSYGTAGLTAGSHPQPQLADASLFEHLQGSSASTCRPRTPDTAARVVVRPHSKTTLAGGGSADASLRPSAAAAAAAAQWMPGSSYLARLHLQRAATADAVCRSDSSSSSSVLGASSGAGRRVSSASAASTSSSRSQALENLKAGRTRSRTLVAAAEAASVSGLAGATGAGRLSPGAQKRSSPSGKCSPGVQAASGSSGSTTICAEVAGTGHTPGHTRHLSYERERSQQEKSQSLDSGVASLTVLLDRINKQKQQLSTSLKAATGQGQQQLQQQQQQQCVEQAAVQQAGSRQQQQQQQQQAHTAQQHLQQDAFTSSGKQPLGQHDSAIHADCGPGERLEFPHLLPCEPPVPRSKSSSYLDVIRHGRVAGMKQQQQQQPDPLAVLLTQQHQHEQQHEQQPPLQYHPSLYQQPLYQPLHQQQQQQRHYEPPSALQQEQQQLGGSLVQQQAAGSAAASHAPASHAAASPAATYTGGLYSSGVISTGDSCTGLQGLYRPPYAPPQALGAAQQQTAVVTPLIVAAAAGCEQAPSTHGMLSPSMTADDTYCQYRGASSLHQQQQQQQARHSQHHEIKQQQKQQQVVLPMMAEDFDAHCTSHSSTLLQQQQQQHGFVISTQPMSERSFEAEPQGTASTAAAAAMPHASGCVDLGSPDQAAAASDAAARRAFLSCRTASTSSAESDDQAGGAAVAAVAAGAASSASSQGTSRSNSGLQRPDSRGLLWTGSSNGSSDTAAGASAAVASVAAAAARLTRTAAGSTLGAGADVPVRQSSRAASSSCEVHQARTQRGADAMDMMTSDSDTDVSEMSSSLDSVRSSSSSSSGSIFITVEVHQPQASFSDPAAGVTAAHRHSLLHSGSISISSANNSSGGSSSGGGGVHQQELHHSDTLYASQQCSRELQQGSRAAAGGPVSPAAAVAAGESRLCARSWSHRGAAGLPRGCCGIKNVGNTCYQNSCVQLLGCVPELVGALLGRQAVQLFEGAEADAVNNHRGAGIQQALRAAADAAELGIGWLPNAAVGPALQALVREVWGFPQQQQQYSSPYQQQQQQQQQQSQYLMHQQQLQRVTDCMDVLRSAMAETDPRWDDGEQWDCQEALCCLLQVIHNESNRVRGRPQYRELKLQGSEAQQAAEAAAYAKSWEDSVVLDIFSWQLQSSMTCMTCMTRTMAFDCSRELLVAIPRGSDNITVQECLARTIFSPETMHGEEGYKCEKCKAVRDATKQLQLFTYPQVLLLGLKRFETRGGSKGGNKDVAETYISRKISARVRVDARDVLDLSAFCNPAGLAAATAAGKPPPRYELVAVADHSGYIHGGHYTARGRCVLDGCWAEFNDSLVTATQPPSGSSSEAYMMLYRLIGG